MLIIFGCRLVVVTASCCGKKDKGETALQWISG